MKKKIIDAIVADSRCLNDDDRLSAGTYSADAVGSRIDYLHREAENLRDAEPLTHTAACSAVHFGRREATMRAILAVLVAKGIGE